MKLKLIFHQNEQYSNKYTIKTYRNKVVRYKGLYPIVDNVVDIPVNGLKEFNSTFLIKKLDKYDKEQFNVQASHEIYKCHELIKLVNTRCFVDLSLFQSIRVNWFQPDRVDELDLRLKKWKVFIFWPAFMIATIGGIFSLYDAIVASPKISKDVLELQETIKETESEQSKLRTSFSNHKNSDSLHLSSSQRNTIGHQKIQNDSLKN